ncbi:MAG: DNRLRE domain-containing protein, partial [Ruminococcus flavefaciens]|nr:DNRLRE domain-containing protein [Ruminococcus flavefaciens]
MKKLKKLRTIAAIMAALFAIQAMPFSAIAAGSETDGAIDHEAIMSQLYAESDETSNAEELAIVAEETDMRGENEKHYRLEDGSYVAAQYPTAVHYKDETGNWIDIDNTLSFEESKSDNDFDGYTNKDNSFNVKLAENAENQLFRLEDGENSISLKLSENEVQSTEISVKNTDSGITVQSELSVEEQNEEVMSLDSLTSKAEYTDVMPGVDLEYTVMPNGVKEYIIVNEKLADYEFSFELALGDMYLLENADKSISIMTSDNEEKYIIPAPYMTDANDRYSDAVEYTVSDMGNGTYTLTVTADVNWLEDSETAFPVCIDPTIISNPDKLSIYNDTFVSSESSHQDTNYNNNSLIRVGYDKDDFKTSFAYIMWSDISAIPSSYVVTSATLKYYINRVFADGETTPIIEVHSVVTNKTSEHITWNDQPSFSEEIIDCVTVEPDSDAIEFDVTKSIYDYVNEKGTFGIVLKEKKETSDKKLLVELYTLEHSETAKNPELKIYYRNQTGIENDYSYIPIDCGNAGTAYVNTYNGDVAFVHEVLDLDVFKMTNVYNTYATYMEKDANNIELYTNPYPKTRSGKGWNISVLNTIFPTTEKEIKDNAVSNNEKNPGTAYIYNDEYGTNVYLYANTDSSDNTFYEDHNNLGYKLTVYDTSYTLQRFDSMSELIWEKEFKFVATSVGSVER